MSKIKVGNVPSATPKTKPSEVEVKELRWAFSFRFWEQRENFGCDKSEPKWFISLLERLRDLSQYYIHEFMTDGKLKKAWRFHEIDWGHKNIPISRGDFNWVSRVYLDNEEEHPFVQFQISQALGRIIGFFDEKDTFNILLFDPLHNIQPSDYSHYRIRPCSPLGCQYSELLAEVNELKQGLKCSEIDCKTKIELANLSIKKHTHAILVPMHEEDRDLLLELLAKGHITSVSEAFLEALANKLP